FEGHRDGECTAVLMAIRHQGQVLVVVDGPTAVAHVVGNQPAKVDQCFLGINIYSHDVRITQRRYQRIPSGGTFVIYSGGDAEAFSQLVDTLVDFVAGLIFRHTTTPRYQHHDQWNRQSTDDTKTA